MCIAAVVVSPSSIHMIGPRRAATGNTGFKATIANASFCCGAVFVHAPLSLLSAWDIARRLLHVERHCLGRVEAEAEQNKHNVIGEHHEYKVGQQRGRAPRALTHTSKFFKVSFEVYSEL